MMAKKKNTNAKGKYNGVAARQRAFLAAYRKCGVISVAAESAKVDRTQHYRWLEDKADDYQERFEHAKEDACEALEVEARRRAVDGWDEPVFHDGHVCGKKRRFSDALLIFLLKGANPEKYRERMDQKITSDNELRIVFDEAYFGHRGVGDGDE